MISPFFIVCKTDTNGAQSGPGSATGCLREAEESGGRGSCRAVCHGSAGASPSRFAETIRALLGRDRNFPVGGKKSSYLPKWPGGRGNSSGPAVRIHPARRTPGGTTH